MIGLLLAAFAQSPTDLLTGEPATSEAALQALRARKPLEARRLAEDVLVADPDDFTANYVVAKVYFEEDANLPRALYHFRKADRILEDVPKAERPAGADKLHCTLLKELGWVAEDMENSALFYASLHRYNAKCTPERRAERGWRLMKDGRFDESRAVAEAGLASDDPWQVALGGNVLCALEAVVRDRAAAVRACEAVIDRSRAQGYDLTVEAYNASTTTLSNLDFDRTDELLQLATRGQVGGSTNPWEHYAGYLLLQGRGTEAIAALKSMQAWRHAQEAPVRAENRAGADAMVAQVLLAAGEGEASLRFIDRALLYPDRRSSTTATSGTTLAAHTLLRLAARRVERERHAEATSTRAFPVRLWRWAASWLPEPADWEDGLAVAGVFTDPKVFRGTFTVYHDDGIPLPVWLLGDLVPVLGPGVVQAELDRQRPLEPHVGIHAYYDALEAEVAWHRGQARTAELVDRALDGLPRQEALLRARVAAIGADDAWRRGEVARALGLYERAMQLDPGAIRRMGLALPATVVSTGGSVADGAASMIARSPRITWSRRGFQIQVESSRVCLIAPGGNQIGCVSGPDEADDPAVALVERWHEEAFALPVKLSRLDMRSLDGTTVLEENARRHALDNVLDSF